MGACVSKQKQKWKINPLNYMNNVNDICIICHEEIKTQKFSFFTCCKQFIHTDCINKYKEFCRNNNKTYCCPVCRD